MQSMGNNTTVSPLAFRNYVYQAIIAGHVLCMENSLEIMFECKKGDIKRGIWGCIQENVTLSLVSSIIVWFYVVNGPIDLTAKTCGETEIEYFCCKLYRKLLFKIRNQSKLHLSTLNFNC